MRFGLISDTHFHNWQAFGQSHDGQISKRLLQQRDNFLQAISYFQKEKVDCIIHGGDWAHAVGTISNEVLNITREVLLQVDLPIEFVCGNHDTPVRISPNKYHIITNIIRELSFKKDVLHFKDMRVFTINYQDDVNYDLIQGNDLVVVHKTPVGSKLLGHTFTDGVNWRKLASQNKFVAFGHIHQTQKLSDNCFVMGPPMKLGFGEEGDRGVWIVDTVENTCKFHKLDYPEFIVVGDPNDVKDDGNYYKLMGAKTKMDNENVVSVVVPEVFKERIQAQDFNGILHEWIKLNGKDESYLDPIKDILGEKISMVKDLYKGRLRKVIIKKFLSVGMVEYDVPETGFTLVSGASDSFSSNGSGKTTIIGESICWAFFGETTKGLTGDDVIMRGEDDCEVILFLNGDRGNYTVRRTRKKGLLVDRQVNDVVTPTDIEGVLTRGMRAEDRQKVLEGILGFDKSVFLSSVYFSQENILMLAKLTDSEKTNMITGLLGFEQYDDLLAKVNLKIKAIELLVAGEEWKKIGFDKEVAVIKERLSQREISLVEKNKSSTELWDTIKVYKAKVEELHNRTETDDKFEKVDYDSQIVSMVIAQEKFMAKVDAVRETSDLLQKEYNDVYNKTATVKANLDSISRERRGIEKDIKSMQAEELGVRCDKCWAVVTKENIGKFVEEKSALLTKLDESTTADELNLEDANKFLDGVTVKKNAMREKEAHFNFEHAKLKPKLAELQKLRIAQEEREKAVLVNRQKDDGEIAKYDSLIFDTKKRITSLDDEIIKLNASKVSTENEIKMIEANIKGVLDRVLDHHNNVVKLEFWKIGFSSKGIPSVLLDRFCNDINSTINGCLSTVSSGTMSIMVTPTKTTKGGEERNKIGLSIQLNGNEVRYEALSGGEKRRVDVSLCFGLNKFVADKYMVPNGLLGFVILDEVFSFLDKTGEEAVAELLRDEGKTRSIFVIDHALNLSSYANRTWIVKKENDVSSLEKRLNVSKY